MAGGGAVRVRGLTALNRAFKLAGKETAKELRKELREVGNIVRDDARTKFAGISARSAAGYRTVVRQRGVAVEQSLRRVTGKRPDYGALQMRRALVPALEENAGEVVDALEGVIDRIAPGF